MPAGELMSINTYQKVFSYTALTKAWHELLANTKPKSRNTVGVDSVSINDFASNQKYLLLKLSKQLQAENFCFKELKPTLIQKTNGKDRLICVPTVEDRVVQRALLEFLSPRYHAKLANKVSYGFVKNRSVKEAAQAACTLRLAKPWVFKTDITSFFDSIDRDIMRSQLRKSIRERSLHRVLVAAMECEVAPLTRANKRRIAQLGIVPGKGLRQGMPLSPFYSNLLLFPFDSKVIKSGLSAIRYADDLIFFADSEEDCKRIAEFCEVEFANLKLSIPSLSIPESKSVVYSPSQPAEFLGLELALAEDKYQLRLSTKQIERIRSEILGYGSVKELLSRGIGLKSLGGVLNSKRNGFLAAYDACTNITELENALSDVERKCLLKIYQGELKLELSKLGAEVHTFLGL